MGFNPKLFSPFVPKPQLADPIEAALIVETGDGFAGASVRAESAFVIKRNGENVLTIGWDGEATFGEGVEPTDAAREFWAALKLIVLRYGV